jgi:hypothetical protein
MVDHSWIGKHPADFSGSVIRNLPIVWEEPVDDREFGGYYDGFEARIENDVNDKPEIVGIREGLICNCPEGVKTMPDVIATVFNAHTDKRGLDVTEDGSVIGCFGHVLLPSGD